MIDPSERSRNAAKAVVVQDRQRFLQGHSVGSQWQVQMRAKVWRALDTANPFGAKGVTI
jgi:hypothetical protein